MLPLMSPQGMGALCRLAASRAVLAFDLDGTLAPIARKPQDAQVAPATAAQMQALSRRWPVAVITGRAVQDAKQRLGFVPQFLFGNHGSEDASTGAAPKPAPQLLACRKLLQRNAARLQTAGITLEDKGLSLAMHYRQAPDNEVARNWLDAFALVLEPGLRAEFGHCVLNIVPADAPDKGDALLRLMRRCGAQRALVVGDDANDESLFAKAPSGSVTVRIGPPQTASLAQFRLSVQSQIDVLLSLLLGLRR